MMCCFTLAVPTASARAPAATAAAPVETASRLAAAEARAAEAKALFRNRVYPQSARMFMEAFATSRRASLVYNAARAYEEGALLRRAESLFLMYLSLPDNDQAGRADANAHLVDVRARIGSGEGIEDNETNGEPAKPAEPVVAAAADSGVGVVVAPPEAESAPRWPLYVALGAGVSAAVMYGVAYRTAAGLDVSDVRDTATKDAYAADRDRASTLRWAAAGVGAAAAIFGLYALTRPSPSAPAAAQSGEQNSTSSLSPVAVAPVFGSMTGMALSMRF